MAAQYFNKGKEAMTNFFKGNQGNEETQDTPMDVETSSGQQYPPDGGQFRGGQQPRNDRGTWGGGYGDPGLHGRDNRQRNQGQFGAHMNTGHHYQHGQHSHGSRQDGRRNNLAAHHEQSGGMFHGQHGYDHQREMELREMQIREQRHRSLQASKQMVYDVYSTTIGMLEEFEDFDDPSGPEGSACAGQEERNLAGKSRETVGQGPNLMDQWEGAEQHTHGQGRRNGKGPNGKSARQAKEEYTKGKKKKRDLARSDIKIPDQSHKTKRDVKAIVEAELVCFQAQLRFCPPEIRDQTKQELVEKTLGWVAAREAKGLKKGLADMYASQLVEILFTGETKLHVPTQWEESTGPAGEEAVMGGVRALQVGQHFGAEQDKQFHDDPNKKAQCPDIRSGPVPEIHGAQRLLEVNPGLREHLQEADQR